MPPRSFFLSFFFLPFFLSFFFFSFFFFYLLLVLGRLTWQDAIEGFSAQELELLICGLTNIDVEDWKINSVYENGYVSNGRNKKKKERKKTVRKKEKCNL